MQSKTCLTSDGLTLTYYHGGGGDDTVLFVNAPGVGAQLWAPIARELEADHTVIAFDYRGSAAGAGGPADGDFLWGRFVEDLSLVLRRESVSAAHFVSWGLGTKLALAHCRAFPAAALSLTAFGVGDAVFGAGERDAYDRAVSALRQALDDCPQSVAAVAALMKGIGGALDPTSLSSLARAGGAVSAALRLIDLLEAESPMANFALAAINTSQSLCDYLRIHEEFLRAAVGARFDDLTFPVVVVEAAEDNLATLGAKNRRRLATIPDLEFRSISPASHFVPLERPLACARLIADAVRRGRAAANAARLTPPLRPAPSESRRER